MKIQTLEISHIRGITSFEQSFDGKNVVILGDNGTGKSSILDAIDFLLTGNITRLVGEGTGGITLREHGIHIDKTDTPEAGYVRAVVQLSPNTDSFEIERNIKNPGELICPDVYRHDLERIAVLANQGHHMLARRQILKYITAAPGDRAKQIQTLLNLSQVEDTRMSLVRAKNKLKKERDRAEYSLESSQGNINSITNETEFDEQETLRIINTYRHTLDAEPIDRLDPDLLKAGISYQLSKTEEDEFNPAMAREQVESLLELTSESTLHAISETDAQLRNRLDFIRRDPALLRSLSQQKLLKLGLELATDDTCPLCDTDWQNHDLRVHIQNKIDNAMRAEESLNEIERLARKLRERINVIASTIERVSRVVRSEKPGFAVKLDEWIESLKALRESLLNPISDYPKSDFPDEIAEVIHLPADLNNNLNEFMKKLVTREENQESSPEQIAYEKLTQLENDVSRFLEEQEKFNRADIAFDRSVILLEHFNRSRSQVFGKLYDDIAEKFMKLYRRLHRQDEDEFTAKLYTEKASLNLEVDFYGRGMHPPHALHSEGHQDSMGLCLYLVLSERLSGNDLHLMLLDDVVMSVDRGHRKQLATLLADEFSHRQLIITTHDSTWHKQLNSAGVVSRSNTLQLLRWNVDIGAVSSEVEAVWESIETDLVKNDVHAASAKLRRWAEGFFRDVCNNLQASVIFKSNGRWTLSDFLDPAKKELKRLIKKAKSAAQNRGDRDLLDKLQLIDDHRSSVYRYINKENWAVNETVHNNPSEDLTPQEFEDVVDAFKQLHDLLHCEECQTMIRLSSHNAVCGCGKINWPLK